MSFVEHLASYFTDFGTDAVIGGASVRGVFDNEYVTSLGLVDGTHPVFLASSSAVSSSSVGDLITVGGVSYSIGRVEPDGTGMTRLILERR
jgi:hypothetical protein